MTAKMPIGGSIIANEVPCAACCERPKKKISIGIIKSPPPIPTIPLKMPANKPIIIRIRIVEILICFF